VWRGLESVWLSVCGAHLETRVDESRAEVSMVEGPRMSVHDGAQTLVCDNHETKQCR